MTAPTVREARERLYELMGLLISTEHVRLSDALERADVVTSAASDLRAAIEREKAQAQPSPGPWTMRRAAKDPGFNIESGGYLVAEVPNISGRACDLANARLIAAAPCMLEALAHCASLLETEAERLRTKGGVPPYWTFVKQLAENARAAIRKATGEAS